MALLTRARQGGRRRISSRPQYWRGGRGARADPIRRRTAAPRPNGGREEIRLRPTASKASGFWLSPASSRQVPGCETHHVARVVAGFRDRRRLEAGMHGAVLAEVVLARFPVVPVGAVPELLEGLAELLADQVAGTLPAVRRVGDRAPGRAGVFAQAGGELQEHRRRMEAVAARQAEQLLELLLDLAAHQED